MLTLRTVLWQRDVELEVIVVDDGSVDGTSDAISALDDGHIRSIRHDTPLGVSIARNHGVDVARGQWVAFLDDDDLWAPNKLEAQIEAAAASDATWCYAGAVKIDRVNRSSAGRPPTAGTVMARLPRLNLVPGGCSGVIANAPRSSLPVGSTLNSSTSPTGTCGSAWATPVRRHVSRSPSSGYRIHHGQASLDADLILREATLMEGRDGISVDPVRSITTSPIGASTPAGGAGRSALRSCRAARRDPAGDGASVGDGEVPSRRTSVAAPAAGPARRVADPGTTWLRALEDPGEQPFDDQATTRRG